MRNHTLTTRTPQAILYITVLAALVVLPLSGNRGLHALCWAVIAAILAGVASNLHDRLSARFKPWKVYVLLDKYADVIYVGSTNHCARRFEEHLEDEGLPWKQQVCFMACARCCWTEKQARRIEERRIKALSLGVEKNKVKVLHNEIHARPADNIAARTWRLLWLHVYRLEGVIYPDIRWLGSTSVDRATPAWAPPAAEPDDDIPDAPESEPTFDRVEATYERRPADRPNTDQRVHVPLLALSPVPMSPCPPPTTPVGGDPGDRGQRGQTQAAEGTTLAARIRAAHQRQATATNPKTAPTTGPSLTAAQADAKRRWDEREKKRRQRAKQAGESYTKQPWPGDLPS